MRDYIKLLIVLVTAGTLLLAGCTNRLLPNPPDDRSLTVTPEDDFVPTLDLSGKVVPSQETLARQLLNDYLEHYKQAAIPARLRLGRSTIVRVDIAEAKSDGFICRVAYSVRPIFQENAWGAGNGTIRPDGWVLNKEQYATVTCKDGVYQLTMGGTSFPGR